MGTIVLPPQDCLSSPHNRQNSYLSSSRSNIGRSSFQAAMVPSPTAEDCARHKHSGGSPPGDGLLPIPAIHGQSRILSSKGSPPSKALSPFCSPHIHRMHSGPSASVKSNLSRSASAILPTPLVGSPPLAEGLLKGRLPFKIVQGNGPGNNHVSVQANVFKKPKEVRSSVRNGTTGANNHKPNKKAMRNIDTLKCTTKELHNGDSLRRQPKNGDVRIRKSLERSDSAKGVCEKSELAEFPVVTILQRPETEAAAAELFAKFFQNGSKQASVYSNQGVEDFSRKSANLCENIKGKEVNGQLAGEEVSDGESSEGSLYRTDYSPFVKGVTSVKKDVKLLASADAGGSAVLDKVGVHFDGGLVKNTKEPVFETVCEELAPWERWAGPSYINSPPPSALPLPRFSKKHSNVVIIDDVHDEQMEDICNEVSTPPSSISPLYASLARQRHLNINLDAVATATKDLKRILNLDLCSV